MDDLLKEREEDLLQAIEQAKAHYNCLLGQYKEIFVLKNKIKEKDNKEINQEDNL